MRVLCSVIGSPSHARAMLPFARALAVGGHDVVVAASPDVAGVFDGAPVRVEAVLPGMERTFDYLRPIAEKLMAEGAGPDADPEAAMARMLPYTFGGPSVTDAARSLLELFPEPPDLVLRDGSEYAALLVAEHWGVPHLPVPSGATNVMAPEMIAGALERRRADLGFTAGDDPTPLFRHGRLDCMPPAWSMARPGTPGAMAYRQDDQVSRGDVLPDWLADLDGDRPLVLAGIGTALPRVEERNSVMQVDPPATLRAILDGVSELDADLVLTTSGIPLDVPENLSPRVHVVEWVAQPLLLQCADLFVTHGGYNGIRESVRSGTPLVVLPQFGDQHHNASRVRELGLGRHSEQTAGAIAENCRAVLADDGVRARARQAQRAMLALPPVEACVDDLVALVAGARIAAA